MDIGFHAKKPAHINPYIGWMAVLCTALLASLPIMLLAAEPSGPPPVGSASSTMVQPHGDVGANGASAACIQACVASTGTTDCLTSAGTNQLARTKCYEAVRSCVMQQCAPKPPAPAGSASGTTMQPPHQEPTTGNAPSNNACTQQCIASTGANDCLAAAGNDLASRTKCYDAMKSCLMQQCNSQLPAPFSHSDKTGSASSQPQTPPSSPTQLTPADWLKGSARIESQLKTFDSAISKERMLLIKITAKFAELKAEAAASPVDTAAFAKSLRDMQSLREQFAQVIQVLQGPMTSTGSTTAPANP